MSTKRKQTKNLRNSGTYGNRNDHKIGFDKLFDEYHKKTGRGLSFLLYGLIIFITNQATIFIGHKIMKKFFSAVSVTLVIIGIIMFSQFFVVFGLFCFNVVPVSVASYAMLVMFWSGVPVIVGCSLGV